jgi:hypothetical protein
MQAEGNATQDELKAQLALAHALGSGQAQVQVPSVSLANRVSASAQSQTQSQRLGQEVHAQAKHVHQRAATPQTGNATVDGDAERVVTSQMGIATVDGDADFDKVPEMAKEVATLPVGGTSKPTPGKQIPDFGAPHQAPYSNQQTAAAAAFAHNSQRVHAGQAYAVHTMVPDSSSPSSCSELSEAEVGVVHHSEYGPPTSAI